MKDLYDAIHTRLKNPIYGYFLLASASLNWRVIFYAIVADVSAQDRIKYFDNHTSVFSLIIYPILITIVLAVLHPWVRYVTSFVSSYPNTLKNVLELKEEHSILVKKKELEVILMETLSMKESELIDRAKRDKEILSIDDSEIRKELEEQIKSLRSERDSLITKSSSAPQELMEFAKQLRENSRANNITSDESERLRKRAEDLEYEAESLLRRKIHS